MKINLPDDVTDIISKLTENGYEAYAVGGCIRDSILCRVPGDWDITTSAKPEEVKGLFRRTIDTGIEHGTVTVMIGQTGYEVTTYRVDGEYEDGRHPKNVEFTGSLREDLRRRDFTINAMAYNETDGMVDMFDGQGDIERGLIRCVGNPLERFTEDALRMLRAVRFSAQLGFDIEVNTANAIKELAATIAKISQERIHTEIGKTLLSPNPDYFIRAYEYGITQIVFPIFDEVNAKETVLKLLKKVPNELYYKYASLFIETSEKEAASMLRKLKLDNDTINKTACLVKYHKMEAILDEVEIRVLINKLGASSVNSILLFEKAYYDVVNDLRCLEDIEQMRALYDTIIARGDCTDIKNLAITGNDLIERGIAPGKEMGIMLKKCLQNVLEHPENNTKDILLKQLDI